MNWKPGDKLRNINSMKLVEFKKYSGDHFFSVDSKKPLKCSLYVRIEGDNEPKHETVEQWEERNKTSYPDDAPVWYIDSGCLGWTLWEYQVASKFYRCSESNNPRYVVANHHGKPEKINC
jgi:hypothetical protein